MKCELFLFEERRIQHSTISYQRYGTITVNYVACLSLEKSLLSFPSDMSAFELQISSTVFFVVLLSTLYSSRGLCSTGSRYELDESSNIFSENKIGNLRRTLSESASSVVGRNDAPHLHHEPKLCANATLFGRPHKGGWNICGSLLSDEFSKAKKCVVYSFGLGADW